MDEVFFRSRIEGRVGVREKFWSRMVFKLAKESLKLVSNFRVGVLAFATLS